MEELDRNFALFKDAHVAQNIQSFFQFCHFHEHNLPFFTFNVGKNPLKFSYLGSNHRMLVEQEEKERYFEDVRWKSFEIFGKNLSLSSN